MVVTSVGMLLFLKKVIYHLLLATVTAMKLITVIQCVYY